MTTITAELEKKILKFPILVVLLTQLFTLILLRNGLELMQLKISPWTFVIVQSFLTSIIVKSFFRLPHWLVTISAILPSLFYLAFHYLGTNTTPYGASFIVLALTFSHTFIDRVPLYFTNPTTAFALKKVLEKNHCKNVLDLGSGTGGVVRAMALPGVHSFGVESAPTLWIFSVFLSLITRKGKILRKNIWKTDLQKYDLVYAFLSPAVMEELWEKVQREMRPGALFISNSFMVPGKKASSVLTLHDGRKTKLYIYKI